MRTLLIMAAVVGVTLGLVCVAVAGGYDRFLVPPPEAAAENFVRQITTGRYDIARHALADATAAVETPLTLRSRFAPLFASLDGIAA